jgi:hypothetical protein
MVISNVYKEMENNLRNAYLKLDRSLVLKDYGID